jgi:hypothetical protein
VRSVTLITLLLIAHVSTCRSQSYYESSGQTAIFTLKAGAKSGPLSTQSSSGSHYFSTRALSIANVNNNIVILLPSLLRGYADISLCDISGRQIFRKSAFGNMPVYFNKNTLMPGIYNVSVYVDGKALSRRFLISK